MLMQLYYEDETTSAMFNKKQCCAYTVCLQLCKIQSHMLGYVNKHIYILVNYPNRAVKYHSTHTTKQYNYVPGLDVTL